jgi:signal transduction histidine kinase
MAERMGLVMGARVEFRDAQGDPDYGKVRREGEEMRVGFALRNGREVWFTRDLRHAGVVPFWKRWDAWVILAGFWSLALVLSLWLGRRVTQPLGRLAAALPGMGGDVPLADLPTDGPKEIAALAAALRETQASILREREQRRQAERLALLGKMAASLAHEVRNPVSAIRLHAQLLERAVSPENRTSAEMIVEESGRIESLVAQWLGYAKPGSMAVSPVDMAALARDIAHALEARAAHAHVEIRVNVDADAAGARVPGDAERLRQVLGNLVLNAIQSMPKGGRVDVRVASDHVEVTDGGHGFSAVALEKFGEPFHSEREGGMGLGLAVSKEIVEAHGGLLEAENRADGGATVRIRWVDGKGGRSV